MDVLNAIEARRAVKHFDPEHRLSKEETETLLSLAMLSPTAFNLQHWRFVVIEDPALRRQIREVSWNQAQITDASLLVVVCADLKAWEKEPARYFDAAPENVKRMVLPMIDGFYRDNDQVQRDEALRSSSLAAQTLMLAAKGMGYDSCPLDGFDFVKVAGLINLPQDHLISMFVVIGKAIEDAHPRMGRLELSDVVIIDRFKT